MSARLLLAALIALATVGFVIGTTVERRNSHHESAAQLRAERAAPAATAEAPAATPAEPRGAEAGGEGTTSEHAAESSGGIAAEAHPELRPLGVNVEAVPFVVLAALASLGLAAAAWARPRWTVLLLVLAASMVAFAVLDVREVFHQHDEARTGLAVLAATIAALHVGAAAVAGRMLGDARRVAS